MQLKCVSKKPLSVYMYVCAAGEIRILHEVANGTGVTVCVLS